MNEASNNTYSVIERYDFDAEGNRSLASVTFEDGRALDVKAYERGEISFLDEMDDPSQTLEDFFEGKTPEWVGGDPNLLSWAMLGIGGSPDDLGEFVGNEQFKVSEVLGNIGPD